jgi:hypothetical protein
MSMLTSVAKRGGVNDCVNGWYCRASDGQRTTLNDGFRGAEGVSNGHYLNVNKDTITDININSFLSCFQCSEEVALPLS